jgi:hypothetical protein
MCYILRAAPMAAQRGGEIASNCPRSTFKFLTALLAPFISFILSLIGALESQVCYSEVEGSGGPGEAEGAVSTA